MNTSRTRSKQACKRRGEEKNENGYDAFTYVELLLHMLLKIISSEENKMNWWRYCSSSALSAPGLPSSISNSGSDLPTIMNTTMVH